MKHTKVGPVIYIVIGTYLIIVGVGRSWHVAKAVLRAFCVTRIVKAVEFSGRIGSLKAGHMREG